MARWIECWLQKKKQLDVTVTELIGEDENKCDVLYVTDKLVGNIDKWIIDSKYSHHISFNRKMFSVYTSVQGREVFMGNSSTSNVIGKGTTQFWSHDKCITTFQEVCHVPESRYNPISLEALHRERFCFSSKGNLMEVFKETHVMFPKSYENKMNENNMFIRVKLKCRRRSVSYTHLTLPTIYSV